MPAIAAAVAPANPALVPEIPLFACDDISEISIVLS
jgi:hypothetical protein